MYDPLEGKFQRGWGVKTKEPSVGGMDFFWNHTIYIVFLKRVFGLALFKNEEYTLYLACVWARTF